MESVLMRLIKLKQIDNSEFTIEVPNDVSIICNIHNFTLNVQIKITDMRKIIALKSGIPENQQRLIYKAKLLKDEDSLLEYIKEDGETLHLIKKPPAVPGSQASAGQ